MALALWPSDEAAAVQHNDKGAARRGSKPRGLSSRVRILLPLPPHGGDQAAVDSTEAREAFWWQVMRARVSSVAAEER